MALAVCNVVAVNALPVTFPVNGPEKPVDVSKPVDGLKLNFVEDTFNGRFPVLAVTHTGYIVEFVVASFAIAIVVAEPVKAPVIIPETFNVRKIGRRTYSLAVN